MVWKAAKLIMLFFAFGITVYIVGRKYLWTTAPDITA